MSIESNLISSKKDKKLLAANSIKIESVKSTVTIDTIIYNEKKKQEIIT